MLIDVWIILEINLNYLEVTGLLFLFVHFLGRGNHPWQKREEYAGTEAEQFNADSRGSCFKTASHQLVIYVFNFFLLLELFIVHILASLSSQYFFRMILCSDYISHLE